MTAIRTILVCIAGGCAIGGVGMVLLMRSGECGYRNEAAFEGAVRNLPHCATKEEAMAFKPKYAVVARRIQLTRIDYLTRGTATLEKETKPDPAIMMVKLALLFRVAFDCPRQQEIIGSRGLIVLGGKAATGDCSWPVIQTNKQWQIVGALGGFGGALYTPTEDLNWRLQNCRWRQITLRDRING